MHKEVREYLDLRQKLAAIDYEPFSGEPLSAETEIWGGFKALYR